MKELDGESSAGAGGRNCERGDGPEEEAGIGGKLALTLFPFLLILLFLLLESWLRGRS